MLQSQLQVTLLVVPELLDDGNKLPVQAGIVVDHLLHLLVVVLGHEVLNRHRACHGPSLPQQSAASPQTEARQSPERSEDSRPDVVSHQELLELGQVNPLVVPHLLDQRGGSRVVPQDCHLT